jgi:hypothetical protein
MTFLAATNSASSASSAIPKAERPNLASGTYALSTPLILGLSATSASANALSL